MTEIWRMQISAIEIWYKTNFSEEQFAQYEFQRTEVR